MNTVFKTRQRGGVILEALMAFLVLGVGVVALLYLQGNLMEGSSLSKAKAEAMELAKGRTEILRTYIDKDQYLAALASAQENEPDGGVQGVNATYTVSYVDVPESSDTAELLTVKVKWNGNKVDVDGSIIEENVVLQTLLYFTKPEVATLLSDQKDEADDDSSDFPLPSPWLTGVEKAHKSTDKFKDDTDTHNSVTTADEDLRLITISDGAVTFDPSPIEVITYYNSETGYSNVEVVHGEEVKLTSFGGIVHKIKGEIILHHDADTELATIIENFKLLASPPSYCVAPICAGGRCLIKSCTDDASGGICNNEIPSEGGGIQYVSYVCYVPGDCTNGDEDGDDTKGCPVPFNPPPDKSLNGGWYGRIGNFNLFLDREKDMICTADTLIGASTPNLTPSREYATHRWELRDPDDLTSEKFIAGNEGINRPFDCNPDPEAPTGEAFAQTFIIAGIVNNDPDACSDIAAQYTAGPSADAQSLFLPPENVIRIVGESTAIPATLKSEPLDPSPYLHPPLHDLTPRYTKNNIVRATHDEHCVLAPALP